MTLLEQAIKVLENKYIEGTKAPYITLTLSESGLILSALKQYAQPPLSRGDEG